MADVQAVFISGAGGLPSADPSDLSRDSVLPGDNDVGSTVGITIGQAADAMGAVKLIGDVVGSEKVNTNTPTTIQPGVVTLAKMATLAAQSVIGNPTGSSATPRAITFDPASFVFVGDQLQATAAAAASDASSMFEYERFGSGAL